MVLKNKKKLFNLRKYVNDKLIKLNVIVDNINKDTFKEKSKFEIFTDSKYLKDGIESWINKWKQNGWKTANKKPVKNRDLWEKLDEKIIYHEIKWNWVKGHANNEFNEKADFLARKYIEEKN